MNTGATVKLKNYIFFREVDDGILFESGQKTFVLKGKGIYPVVARVIRFLDTGIEVAGMLRQLPEKVVPFAQRLLEELQRHGMLLNAAAEQDLFSRYQGQPQLLEFIRFLQDNLEEDYAAAFHRWQKTEVLLLGNGYALKSALGGLVNSGVGTITLCHLGGGHLDEGHPSTGESHFGTGESQFGKSHQRQAQVYPTAREFDSCLEQRQQQDRDFQCRRLAGADLCAYLQVSTARLTLVCADDLAGLRAALPEDVQTLLRNTPYMVAGAEGGYGFISPLNETGYTNFADLREWLAAAPEARQIPAAAAAAQGQQAPGQSPAGLALTGALAAYNFIKHGFGIDKVFLRNHCALVSPFLDVDYHPVLPVAALERAAPLLPVEYKVPFEVPEGRPVSRYETLLMNLAPAFDRMLGPFSPEPAKKLKQLPLYHDAIQVRFPLGCGLQPQVVHSWGVSAEDAGMRTLARALALYARVQSSAATVQSSAAPAQRSATTVQSGANAQGHDPAGVVAAFDRASWLRQATALAVIRAADFSVTAVRAYLHAEEMNNADIQMLVRILRLYVAQPLRVDLYWREGAGAFAARIPTAAGVVGLGYGATPDQAVLECLGDACSAFQFPQLEQAAEIDLVRHFPAAEQPLSPSVLRDYAEFHAPQLPISEHILNNLFNTDAYTVGAVALVGRRS